MKFTFQYPAKIFIGETSRKFRTFQHGNFTVISFDAGGIYWCQKTQSIKWQSFDGVNEYWLSQNDFAIRLRTHNSDDDIKNSIDHFADIQERFGAMLKDIINPSEYEARAAQNIAERQAQREKENQEKQARENWNEMVNQAEIENAGHDFKAGKMISGEHFEALLKQYDIKLHIRTLGSIRNRVKSISTENAKTYGQGFLPQKIWDAVNNLKISLDKVNRT